MGKPYQITAFEMKYLVSHYWIWKKKHTFCFTEYTNGSDVWSCTRAGYATETEIKVNANDLASEIACIKHVKLKGKVDPWLYKGSRNKLDKHLRHLTGEGYYISREQCPKYFYFAVPDYLEDLALAGIEDTPYGLLVFDYKPEGEVFSNWWDERVVVEAKPIAAHHKMSDQELTGFATKATFELLEMRRKYTELNRKFLNQATEVSNDTK